MRSEKERGNCAQMLLSVDDVGLCPRRKHLSGVVSKIGATGGLIEARTSVILLYLIVREKKYMDQKLV